MIKRYVLSAARAWIEYRGRKIPAPVVFQETGLVSEETEIVTERLGFPMKGLGSFLALPPMTAAILTSPTGQRNVFSEGGYIRLPTGKYILEYVDLRERRFMLPINNVITSDGLNVSFFVSINYQVTNPLRVLNTRRPLEALFSACEASIKSFIRSRPHDAIIGDKEENLSIIDSEISRYIIQQIGQNHACRAFTIMGVTITELQGDQNILEIRKARLLQERESQVEREKLVRQQEIAEERKNLERKKAEQEGMIRELQAQFEANQKQILYKTNQLALELENLRKLPQMQQEQYLKALDVKQKALEALIQAQAMPGFPRNTKELEIVNSIVNSMTDMQNLFPSTDAQLPPVKELSTTLINLILPNKRNSPGENS
jgi:hypothetical protein